MDSQAPITVSRKIASASTAVAGRFVIQTGTDSEVTAVTGANANAYGVLMEAPRDNDDWSRVAVGGIVQVEAGGAISDGDEFITDASGRAVTDPQTGATTSNIRGKALCAASGSGVLFGALLYYRTAKY